MKSRFSLLSNLQFWLGQQFFVEAAVVLLRRLLDVFDDLRDFATVAAGRFVELDRYA